MHLEMWQKLFWNFLAWSSNIPPSQAGGSGVQVGGNLTDTSALVCHFLKRILNHGVDAHCKAFAFFLTS